MNESLFVSTRRIYGDQGLRAVAVQAFKKLLAPFARVGSLYFLERDLNSPMPPLRHIRGIVMREGSLSDVHLLDAVGDAERHKKQAVERLARGDRWFIGIDEATGKLANYRWASMTRGFIPEIGRELIVKPREAYVYDLHTLPEFRRHGIEGYMRHFTYEYLNRRCGINRIVVYICADNHASLQAGRQYLTYIGRVWYFRRLGCRAYLFARGNSRMPDLRSISDRQFRALSSSSDPTPARKLIPDR